MSLSHFEILHAKLKTLHAIFYLSVWRLRASSLFSTRRRLTSSRSKFRSKLCQNKVISNVLTVQLLAIGRLFEVIFILHIGSFSFSESDGWSACRENLKTKKYLPLSYLLYVHRQFLIFHQTFHCNTVSFWPSQRHTNIDNFCTLMQYLQAA